MKSAEEFIIELQNKSGGDLADCLEDHKEAVIKMVKAYAYEVVNAAINQTEICCNNFHPTITLIELVEIKNNLP